MIKAIGLLLLLLLKIIGWILLGVLILLLISLLVLLFVPVRYTFEGESNRIPELLVQESEKNFFDGIKVKIKVTWLMHLFCFTFLYGKDGASNELRIFGIDLFQLAARMKKRKRGRRHEKKQAADHSLPDLFKDGTEADDSKVNEVAKNESSQTVDNASNMKQADTAKVLLEQKKAEQQAQIQIKEVQQAQTEEVQEQIELKQAEEVQEPIKQEKVEEVQEQTKIEQAQTEEVQEQTKIEQEQIQITQIETEQAQTKIKQTEVVQTEADTEQEESIQTKKKKQQDKQRAALKGRQAQKKGKREKKGQKEKQYKEKQHKEKRHKQKRGDTAHTSKAQDSKSQATSFRQKIQALRKELADIQNHNALKHLWREICYILRNYKPKKLQADLAFSCADPALTGEIVGVLSWLPLIYRYPCQIFPDFSSTKFYLEGSVQAKGKVTVCFFVRSTLRLFRDKDFMRLVRKITGREKKTESNQTESK